jgi:glycosyltransferase involved in cell wall biosynthesis
MKTAPPVPTFAQKSVPNDTFESSFERSRDWKAPTRGNRRLTPVVKPRHGKPRILILPNVASWIVGQMAMHIMERFKDRYEFWMLTDKMLRLRPDLVKALIPGLDFIFPLTDKSYSLLRKAAGPLALPPSIFWVHHVTSWNPSMLVAAHDARELIVCTPEWKTEIEKQCPGSAITVIPHGVDADFFHRVPRQRARFGAPENAFVVGFIGNKTSNYDGGRKGLDTLEIAMRELRKSVPNLHVCFLGLGWDEEVVRFRRQGISANYTGFIPQSSLPAFYSAIDVHVVSSRIEGGPVTVLEAMACETAVVSTRVGLVPHTVVDGENGFSAEIGDVTAMVRALHDLWASPQLLDNIGVAARAAVYPHRSWSKVLDELEEPLARMESRSTRSTAGSSPASAKTAAQLAGAVHTMDGLLWGLMSWWQGLLSPRAAGRMVKACWEGYDAVDVLRGVGLITRSWLRPAWLQNGPIT